MKLSRSGNRLDPASIRLPLIALIDVILFLLVYFMMAGTLAAEEEAQLATSLKTERGGGKRALDLQPQVVFVEMAGGKAQFRLGERALADRAALVSLLKQLPKDNGVMIRVAGDVPVAAAATAIQASKDAGFAKVSYVPGR